MKKLVGINFNTKSFLFEYLKSKKKFIAKNNNKKNKCKDDKMPRLGLIFVLIPEEKPNKILINGKYD